jgi:mono/diheme cytochrome c family protein
MKAALLLLAASLGAQDLAAVLKQGEEVFAKTCSSGYCHGGRGAGGGAPRLSGRGFDQGFLNGLVARGVAGTAMPGFASTMSRVDLTAVVAYVASLNGVANPNIGSAEPALRSELAGEPARGRTLFSEAARGFERCSTCHEVAGIGIPVATPISKVPTDSGALRNVQTPSVMTGTIGGENLPILMVSRKAQSVLFYDLTSAPPVLRTALPSEIQTRDGSSWSHASVTGGYTPEELNAVLAYLRTVLR